MTLIDVLVMTDGRVDYLTETVRSFEANVLMCTDPRLIGVKVIHDDSGTDGTGWWLADRFPDWSIVATPRRSGFDGAYNNAWRWCARNLPVENPGGRYLFSTEDDFTFNRPVNLAHLVHVLEACPWLAQMAFRRQPWNPSEVAAGGIVERDPLAYTQYEDNGFAWLEHRLFWTTNPSLHRVDVCAQGWPLGPQSEGQWKAHLLTKGLPWTPPDELRFGYWGGRDTTPWVHHIGQVRAGKGY